MIKSFQNIDKFKFALGSIFCLLPMLYYGILYKHLPYLIPMHYNLAGQPDNFIDKASYTFVLPIIALVLNSFFIWIMHLNPKIKEVKSYILYAIPYFLIPALLNLFAILNLVSFYGIHFNINTVLAIVFGGIIIVIGYFSINLPLNSAIGLRTPWSKANQHVWSLSNKFAGILYIISGVLYIILGMAGFRFYVFVILIVLSSLISTIMSYVFYKLELQKSQDSSK